MSAHQYYLFDVLFMRVVFNRAANRIKLGDFWLVAARVKTTGQTSFAAQWTKSKCKTKQQKSDAKPHVEVRNSRQSGPG